MEKYLPIKVQTQISETLKVIPDKRFKKYLEQYEVAKYEE